MALNRPVDTSQARGFAGTPFSRPLLHRRHERVVQRLLGQIEIAEEADEGREHAARFRAVYRIDLVAHVSRNVFLHSLSRRTATRWRARQSGAPRSSRTWPMECARQP